MRIGLIGAGNISGTHARAAAAIPGVEIVAVWSMPLAAAEAFAAAHGARAYPTIDAFFDEGRPEVVLIGTPSGVHAEQAIAAAHHRVHALVEKPLDIATSRIDALNAAARDAGITVGVFFQDRLKPEIARLKQAVDRGVLGTPVLASAQVKWYRDADYYKQSVWRGTSQMDGGGALINQAIHTVDLMLWLMGPVKRVSAYAATRLHQIEAEDTLVAALEFESGALGTIEAGTSIAPGYPRRLELTGAHGTVMLEGDRIIRNDLAPEYQQVLPVSAPESSVAASSAIVADASAHQRVIEDFIDAVKHKRAPVCDGVEGRKSVALIEEIYTATRR